MVLIGCDGGNGRNHLWYCICFQPDFHDLTEIISGNGLDGAAMMLLEEFNKLFTRSFAMVVDHGNGGLQRKTRKWRMTNM